MTRELAGSARMRLSARPRPSEIAVERPVRPISALSIARADRAQVVGQRRGDVGAVGEDDDADPVAAAGLHEAGGDALDRVEARGGLAVEREVLDRHAAGEVEREDDVAAGGGAVGDRHQPLRPGEGGDEAEPEHGGEQAGTVEPAARDAAGAGGDGRRQVERLPARAARRQQAHEEGQRQQQEGERQGEVNHAALAALGRG